MVTFKNLRKYEKVLPELGGSVVVKKLEEVIKIVNEARLLGKKIVTTNGSFDLVHVGHKRLLEAAKAFGDILVVGVNTDASVKAYKGENRPIVGEKDRAELVDALKPVDYVFLFDEREPSAWIEKIKPDVHVKGSDYKLSKYLKDEKGGYKKNVIIEQKSVERSGGVVKLVPLVGGFSTTSLIQKMSKHGGKI